MLYKASYYDNSLEVVEKIIESFTKKDAEKTARNIARQEELRLLEIEKYNKEG